MCGVEAGLAFGEGTPTSAYKGNPARVFGFDAWLIQGRDAPGPYTLCDDCSQIAAELYMPEFRRWTRLAQDLIARGAPADELDADPRPTWSSAEFAEVRPARFLKQVVTMLLAITPAGFLTSGHVDLGEYARNPRRVGLPPRYQFYLTLFRGPYARFVGHSAQRNPETGQTEQLIELAYPPFSCVLSLAGDAAIETTNITGFSELRSSDVCIIDLDLLNGFGHTPFPADFRTLAAVDRERVRDGRRQVA
ncbi:MAG: hypothetical protein QOC55_719 [Thermoleophilaceae bacterium]|nr:hypothetical protein [Thermoleophilaceae bacterium]